MLQKVGVDISFAQGLDTKTDPKRVQAGKFLSLVNMVFNKGGQLQKRNGFPRLSALPDTTYTHLTTFKDNLTAIGNNIAAYNNSNQQWVTKGNIQPLKLSTQPVIRNNLNQTAADTVIASNGLACTVYIETNAGTNTNKYVIYDSITGQNIIAPSVIPVTSGVVSGGMRVFYLGTSFVILFVNTISASDHFQYVSINSNDPSNIGTNTDIETSFVTTTNLNWDAVVSNDRLYIGYNTTNGGQAIKVKYLTSSFVFSGTISFSAKATLLTMTVDITDESNPIFCLLTYRLDLQTGTFSAFDQNLFTLVNVFNMSHFGGLTIDNITMASQNNICSIAFEIDNSYSFSPGTGNATNYISTFNFNLTAHAQTAVSDVIRSVGLASKAFIVNEVIYFLAAYNSSYQTTYFLINLSESTSSNPVITAKIAYSNGGGYITQCLPDVSIVDNVAYINYLFKDLLQAVNKGTALSTGTQTAGIFSQTGINIASITIGAKGITSSEIGNDLQISGGFLWMYDGYLPVEHNFFLWPDMAPTSPPNPVNTGVAAWATTGGSIHAQPDGSTNTNAYYYQVTYEWSDNQGNIFRSAPSIPIAVTTTSNGTIGSIALNIPTLRLTMKTANPVKIVIYRWSVAQQNYYQVTSITSPLLNSTTVDSVFYRDTASDATILGNNLLYTTGGVVEDVNAPASDVFALFDTRFWLVDAENPNNLWFSKQVIQGTCVEMSDLFTLFVPPTTATQQSTGPIKSLCPMDDKLIIGKDNALLYINGNGPDNTGANNQYSDPIFITSTVGCNNQQSMVLIPLGLMFQSNKGIWILGRDLNPSYIGAPVEDFTIGANVTSAVNVPETNQVRFTLDSGVTIMYDYYYDQWGTFKGVPAISSCIFENMHTLINSSGQTSQETEGTYQDGSNPVLMSFKTGPLRLGDLQNYQRAYFFYLLGTYISPHKLNLNIYYDYSDSPSESHFISPNNYSTPYGSGLSQSPYGQGNPYGGPSNLENWRVFLQRQRCMAFAIELQEIFDSTLASTAGAGLTLSGINVVMGFKKSYRPQSAATSVG